MPRRSFLPTSLVAVALLASLVASARADENQTKLATSKAAWLKVRDAAKGNYQYDVTFQTWTGHGHTTTILVRDNQPIERRFRKFNRQQPEARLIGPEGVEAPQPRPAAEGWIETAEQLGKHFEGAPAKTIDDLYTEAEAILKNPLKPHEKLYLTLDANGLLKACVVANTLLADAPAKGPTINALRMEEKK